MPFPTRPETIGTEKRYSLPIGPRSVVIARLVSVAIVAKHGDGNCEDHAASDTFAGGDSACWSLQTGVPFYGLGAPRWILEVSWADPYESEPWRLDPIYVQRMYTTYAACVWAQQGIKDEGQKTWHPYAALRCVEMPRSAP
jgi:hypothetical protein